MGKKKKQKKKSDRYLDSKPLDKYEEIIEFCPAVANAVTKDAWEFITKSNVKTVGKLFDNWKDNMEKNIRSGRWERCGGVYPSLLHIGKNKAMIAVGAGQSLNKNKHVLKRISDIDGQKPWEERGFYIVASNHMYKPLLNMNIIPDFVVAVDGSDVIYKQLCVDIPEHGRNTIFLAGVHCDPTVLDEWERQGREIRFYVNYTKGLPEIFTKETGQDPDKNTVIGGGNVMNCAWVLAMRHFGTTAYIGVGNDLSYPLCDTLTEQRDAYYADGDYSSNAKQTGTGRDEARANKKWMGINNLTKSPILKVNPNDIRYNVELDVFGTSPTLWIYKIWIETQIILNTVHDIKYHYYNCTEGGILGVINKDPEYTDEGLNDRSNWLLIDEVCERWHTMSLEDAIEQIIRAKTELQHPGRILGNYDVLDAPAIKNALNPYALHAPRMS